MPGDLLLLMTTTAGVALAHTLMGPDHYLPFIAMSRAGRWSRARTLRITLLCGVGHIAVSLLLGLVGVALGFSLEKVRAFDELRGAAAAWVLIGFGALYAAWGLRRALRLAPHSHWHAHADGLVHSHTHEHAGDHVHVHAPQRVQPLSAWALFTVFLLGPCEPLIPLMLVPAAVGTPARIVLVAAVFTVVTLAAMLAVVAVATLPARSARPLPAARYGHAIAGGLVCACGIGMRYLGL